MHVKANDFIQNNSASVGTMEKKIVFLTIFIRKMPFMQKGSIFVDIVANIQA